MRIAYDNFIDAVSSASIVASSELVAYPATNVQDQRLSVKWYSDSSTSQTVVIDLGATAACSILAVVGHNCATGGTVVVNGNDSIASGLTWVTSGQSSTQTITYNAGMMVKFISPLSNRYWRFSFSGQTAGLEIGRLWLGDYFTVTPSSLNDFTVTKRRDDVVVYGRGRQKYASEGAGWREFELTFPRTSGTTLSYIQTLYDSVGKHSSFIFCNFDDLRTYPLVDPCYVSIADDIGFSHTSRQFYEYSLSLAEDL